MAVVHNTGKHRFFFQTRNGKAGIKIFPRVGSGSLRATIAGGVGVMSHATEVPFAKWVELPRKVVVVRDPWARLKSLWDGRLKPNGLDHRLFGAYENLDQFVREFILAIPDEERDWHARTMSGQLQGYVPEDKELFDLKWVAKNGLPHVGPMVEKVVHKTEDQYRNSGEIDYISSETKEAWVLEYAADFDLWERAKKP